MPLPRVRPAPLTFCDLSTFYHSRAGGVRSYYRAKLRWFSRQDRLRYVLVSPGPGFIVRRVGAQVTRVTVYGARIGKRHRPGYRAMADLRRVRAVVRECDPDVLETGDPWITGPVGLVLRQRGDLRGIVSSFYHSDPMPTYLSGWFNASWLRPIGSGLSSAAESGLTRLQSLYDVTLVSSRLMEQQLLARRIPRLALTPFGADSHFFEAGAARAPVGAGRRRRLLYAGRLDNDKGFDVFLVALKTLLQREDLEITVLGRGCYESRVSAIRHPRFRYGGFISRVDALATVYASHDILLAPGPYETFGLSALEGMASGLVVIGPDRGGTAELLETMPFSCRFAAGSSDALVEAVERAIDGDLVGGSCASREVAERYGTWDTAISREVATYGEWGRR